MKCVKHTFLSRLSLRRRSASTSLCDIILCEFLLSSLFFTAQVLFLSLKQNASRHLGDKSFLLLLRKDFSDALSKKPVSDSTLSSSFTWWPGLEKLLSIISAESLILTVHSGFQNIPNFLPSPHCHLAFLSCISFFHIVSSLWIPLSHIILVQY